MERQKVEANDSCCICLETVDKRAPLHCCSIVIHKTCLFEITLNKFRECPLCRTSYDICRVFAGDDCNTLYNSMSPHKKQLYKDSFASIVNELTPVSIVYIFPHRPYLFYLQIPRHKFNKNVLLIFVFTLIYTSILLFQFSEKTKTSSSKLVLEENE